MPAESIAMASITPFARFWLTTETGWATADAPKASTKGTLWGVVTRTFIPLRSSIERTGLSRVRSTGGPLAQIARTLASYSSSKAGLAASSAAVHSSADEQTPG